MIVCGTGSTLPIFGVTKGTRLRFTTASSSATARLKSSPGRNIARFKLPSRLPNAICSVSQAPIYEKRRNVMCSLSRYDREVLRELRLPFPGPSFVAEVLPTNDLVASGRDLQPGFSNPRAQEPIRKRICRTLGRFEKQRAGRAPEECGPDGWRRDGAERCAALRYALLSKLRRGLARDWVD